MERMLGVRFAAVVYLAELASFGARFLLQAHRTEVLRVYGHPETHHV